MTKGSGKKKKSSPPKNDQANMPKVTRTPPKNPQEGQTNGPAKEKEGEEGMVALLLAMEARLSSKLDANKKAVNEAVRTSKLNSDALDALEEKVDATDEILKETLARVEAQEERVLARVEEQVKEMVREQLRAAGFDSQLSAGDLSTRTATGTYAAAAASQSHVQSDTIRQPTLSKEQRQEEKFWESRRSLRIWPVPEASEEQLRVFLKDKLRMDETFITEDMGQVIIKKNMERKPKNKDEVCVIFESKQIRDAVKAQGTNLANYKDEAGMRLQIPDNLQKDFKALMAVAYDLKQKNKDLRRNVKFDEETMGLFMDVQTEREGNWKRIRPQQAYRLNAARPTRKGPEEMEDAEIASLIGDGPE